MEVVICATVEEVGRVAAGRIARVVRERIAREPDAEVVIGLATGSSPLSTYADLARRVDAGELDLTRAWAFALDEYVGLPAGHPESYAEIIRTTVTEPLHLDPARVAVPDGFGPDLQRAGERYEEAMRAVGGVDVQLVGIGTNGHIGFNEPGSSLVSRTRFKTLTRATRVDNSRFFGSLDEVPRHCLTQGLGTILDARHVVLVAHGAGKAAAVASLVEGPLGTSCPASVLQLHPSATVVVDTAAASALAGEAYYREAYEHKPAWQRWE